MTYIDKCDVFAKILPNMAKYPQKHIEMPQVLMVVLAMDTIGHLPDTSKGH